ncbi:glycosyltransferase family 4 protein [Sphingomonas sp. BGYR3]|uniref:glycosyltransferase family 4 protein n=1 Tax=Sphingomonas sp. BGYR3 TaxID=2975483 RepID=UPI0021A4B584|nr:glycosyltransferase family 4 protein [Sphingomonas sp. BGYR3]MDG5487099.1 glycosyltransferase family 4 protein [Sphingomonas sp. BGYR3]
MAQPIHILHLHSSFDLGGKEARAVRLMAAFGDRARHTIVSGVPDALGARAAIPKGVRYEIAQDPPPLTGKPSVARYEAIARFMRRFDLVLTYNWGAIDGVMAKRVFPKGTPPVVHHEDGFNEDEASGLNPIRNVYRRFALGAAHALVVPSHILEKIALGTWKQPSSRVHRIANGIPVARYAQACSAKAIPGFVRRADEVVVGTLAGMRPVKDLPMLVRAVAGVVHARVRLVIVGEGPERAAIMDAAELNGMDDMVHLPGFLPEPWRYMGLFDIFALSSRSEQQPIAVMEAMAAGLPVVSTPVGDIARMVAPENEPLISIDHNPVHLRDRIQVMALDADARRRIGAANQAQARALFDEDRMIAAYAALYAGAMGRPGILG